MKLKFANVLFLLAFVFLSNPSLALSEKPSCTTPFIKKALSQGNSGPDEKHMYLFAAMPNDERSFHNIFGVPPTSKDKVGIKQWNEALESLKDERSIQSIKFDSIEKFSSEVRTSSSDYIVVVGHNENGILHLGNDQKIGIEKVVSIIDDSDKVPIIISCNSKRYSNNGLYYKTTYKEGFRIAKALSNDIKRVQLPPDAIKNKVRKWLTKHEISGKVIVIAKKSAIPTACGVVIYLDNRETVNHNFEELRKYFKAHGLITL